MVVARGLSLLALLNSGPPRENGDCTIRLARRDDLLRIASLINGAFAIPRERNGLERSLNTARLALDVERRLTPWNWNRHQQLVAESSGGDILGFVELWAEDSASVDKLDAQTPQPCLFNLCVAEGARRSGVRRGANPHPNLRSALCESLRRSRTTGGEGAERGGADERGAGGGGGGGGEHDGKEMPMWWQDDNLAMWWQKPQNMRPS